MAISHQLTFDRPYQTVFDTACAVMPTIGMFVRKADPAIGMISASTRAGTSAWGAYVNVRVWAIDEHHAGVSVEASPKYGFSAWWRKGEYVNQVVQAISNRLAATPT